MAKIDPGKTLEIVRRAVTEPVQKAPDVRGLYEEIANSSTAAFGLGLAVCGTVAIVTKAEATGDQITVVSCLVFGLSTIAVYLFSTLYHAFQVQPFKHWFRVLDHQSIYLIIAGSYTPYLLITLRNDSGWTVCWMIWGLAAVGLLYKLFFFGRSEVVSVLSYVCMGYMIFFVREPMLELMPREGLLWLAACGVSYTTGVYFYWKDHKAFYHTIWHFFVLGGSICHYISVYCYVLT